MRFAILQLTLLLSTSTLACGVLTIGRPTAEPEEEAPRAAPVLASAAPPAPTAPPRPSRRGDCPPRRFGLASEGIAVPVEIGNDSVESASAILAYYETHRSAPPAQRLPSDVMIAGVRCTLHGVDSAQAAAADALFERAIAAATDLPANVGTSDEGAHHEFLKIARETSLVIAAARAGKWADMGEYRDIARRSVARYEAQWLGGKESARARALLVEAEAVVARYAEALAATKAATEASRRDLEIRRLDSEETDLDRDARELQGRLGLGSGDSGCKMTSADPVTQMRLKKLCPIVKRQDALKARREALEKRFLAPVQKKYPSPSLPK